MVCQQCNIIMYADDTVIFMHDKNAEEVVNKTDVLVKVISWLSQCYLKLNLTKTACMFFSKGHSVDIKQGIFRDGPHCRTQDPGGGVGSRSNSSHLT